MSIRRSLVCVPSLFLLACAFAAEPAAEPAIRPAPAPTTSATDSNAGSTATDAAVMARIDALITSAIANGFPDGTGALLFKGSLVVIEDKPKDEDEADQAKHAALDAARQMGRRGGNRNEDNEHITTTYEGLHAKLKDGSFLIGLNHLQKATVGVVINVDKLTPLAPSAVRTSSKLSHEPSDEQMKQVTQNFSSKQMAGMHAAMRWSGVLEGIGYQGSSEMAAVLIRAGVPDAHELIWAEMFGEMSSQMMASAQPLYLNQQDAQMGMEVISRRMMARYANLKGGVPEMPKMPDATLDTYLRKGLAQWFKGQIVTPDSGMTEARAINGLRAILGDAVNPAQREDLRLFDEYAKLPATVAADASVVERLARWEPETLPQGMTADMLAHMDEDSRAQMHYKPASGPAITDADRGALFAALDDVRASGWLDSGLVWSMIGDGPTPRTRGENALRALAGQYGFDPRLLVGRDQFAPWDAAERSATAKALQTWFKEHSAEPLAQQMKAVVTNLPAGRAAVVIANQPETDRPALVSAVLATWKTAQPTGPDADGLGAMLVLAKSDPTSAAIVNAWPIAGSNRLLLATWHELHGDGKALDALIPEILTAPPGSLDMMAAMGSDEPDAQSLLAVVAARPTPERLAALKIQLAEHTTAAANHVIQATVHGQWESWTNQDLMALLNQKSDEDSNIARNAIGFSLMAALLADRTAIPVSTIKKEAWGITIGEIRLPDRAPHQKKKSATGTDQPDDKKDALPADLRWCDVAAASVVGNPWQYRSESGSDTNDMEFKMTAPLAERDQQIAAIRIAIDPAIVAACKAAKLPAPTGGTPAAANEKSLF